MQPAPAERSPRGSLPAVAKTKKSAAKRKPGRPRAVRPKGQQLAFRVDDETAARFEALCAESQVDRSVMLRLMVLDAVAGRWKLRGPSTR